MKICFFNSFSALVKTRTFCTPVSHGVKSYSESLENLHKNGIRFGQPTHLTHSHLLKPNELAIGLKPSEFADRRYRLMEKIQQQCITRGQPNRNIVSIFGNYYLSSQYNKLFILFAFFSGDNTSVDEKIHVG